MPFFAANPEDQLHREHFSTRDEIGVLWAIFDDGVQTYCREILRGGTSVTSFSNLCEVFGIDPSRMHAALLQLREQPNSGMVERVKRALG